MRARPLSLSATLLALITTSRVAAAEPGDDAPARPVVAHGPFELAIAGYGELAFAWLDYGQNQNRDGGAQRDARLVFDTARFVLELEAEMERWDLEVETEIEFEHGGTGGSMELEYEEFGEFESEVEAGGEVIIEELYVEKGFGEHVDLRAGRFYLALGLLSEYHQPTDYLGADRPESATTVIPGVWDELGVGLDIAAGPVELRAQVVNGLDSTGFSSQHWVRDGHQGRFEEIRATDLAYVLRADYVGTSGLLVGASGYYGNTTRNRPKPDLVPDCDQSNEDRVAPCGYTQAAVAILDAHARLEVAGVRGQAVALWGHLDNSDEISARNARLSNGLNVLRSPVAEQAIAVWTEWGYDIAPLLGASSAHRVEPFVRFEYYDTMFRVAEPVTDSARFERYVYSGGLAYTLASALVTKVEVVHRDLGLDALRTETGVHASLGFVY